MVFLLEASVLALIGSLREVIDRAGGYAFFVFEEWAAPILWIVLAMTLARFAWIFACDGITVLEPQGWPLQFRDHGMARIDGAELGPACAVWSRWPWHCPCPRTLRTGRDFLLVAAFAVILITVLIQGTTLGFAIRWLHPRASGSRKAPLNMSQAESATARAS